MFIKLEEENLELIINLDHISSIVFQENGSTVFNLQNGQSHTTRVLNHKEITDVLISHDMAKYKISHL